MKIAGVLISSSTHLKQIEKLCTIILETGILVQTSLFCFSDVNTSKYEHDDHAASRTSGDVGAQL